MKFISKYCKNSKTVVINELPTHSLLKRFGGSINDFFKYQRAHMEVIKTPSRYEKLFYYKMKCSGILYIILN